DLFIPGRRGRDARFACRLFERRGIRIAERDEFRVSAERETGEMILQRDTAATDDRDAESFSGHGGLELLNPISSPRRVASHFHGNAHALITAAASPLHWQMA